MINFEGAKILDYHHSNVYFGELFRYGTRKNISLQGEIYALDNAEGVQPVWSGMSGFVDGAIDYDNIVINNVNFGPGRIDAINFDVGVDVRRKNYSASLTIFDTGNLFNLTGVYYNGLEFLTGLPIHLLESFSESLDFDVNDQKEGSFDQNLSIRFVSGAAASGTDNPKYLARVLASGLMNSNPAFPLLAAELGVYVGDKKYISESYNEITNECSFSFRQKVSRGDDFYGFTYSHSVNVNNQGIATVVENGKIEGLDSDVWGAAQSGYDIEFPLSYTRASGVYSYHVPNGELDGQYTSLEKGVDKFRGLIDYTVTFSDNPNLNETYIWEYSHEINQAEPCIFNVAENGNIKGRSTSCSSQDKYTNALAAWEIIQPGISGRSQGFYQGATSFTKPLKLVGKSQGKSEINGEVSYSYLYTDHAFYGISGFKRLEYSVQDSNPVPLVSKYNIPNVKELVQPANIATVGGRSVSVQVIGDRSKPLTDYLSFAKNLINGLKPTGGDVFINGAKYSFAPTESSFNIETSWSFFGNKAFTDTTV